MNSLKRLLLLLCLALSAGMSMAQEGVAQPALVVDTVNVRAGDARTFDKIGEIAVRTNVVVEARNRIGDWVLVRTEGGLRGWVASRYVIWDAENGGITLANLPISEERFTSAPAPVVAGGGASEGVGSAPAIAASVGSTEGLSERSLQLVNQLSKVPVIPTFSTYTRQLYREAVTRVGRTPTNFAKVGDCNTYYPFFMQPFSRGNYDLGEYSYLQSTIDYYRQGYDSFMVESMAGQIGHLTTTIIDPIFSDTVKCGDKTMLSCEYHRQNSPVALIMLGMSEAFRMDEAMFRQSLDSIVQQSVAQYVVPVFFTVPVSLQNNDNVQRMLEFNRIIVEVANYYRVPVVNLWLATQPLPSNGLEADRIHPTNNEQFAGYFTGWQNEYAATMWNLLALQVLDQFRRLNG